MSVPTANWPVFGSKRGQSRSPLFDLGGKRVYVAGHAEMVGAALVRRLRAESCTILTVDHATLDLTRQAHPERWIRTAKPDAVLLAAAKVGGPSGMNDC
jgi:GDP-L-fucose synthase